MTGRPGARTASSTSAFMGARPVPPATQRMSRPESASSAIVPDASPSSTVSPILVWRTSAPLIQPAGTARTWILSSPSGRGALAIEKARQAHGQREDWSVVYWPARYGRGSSVRKVSTAMSGRRSSCPMTSAVHQAGWSAHSSAAAVIMSAAVV